MSKVKTSFSLTPAVSAKLPELQKAINASWEHERRTHRETLPTGQVQEGLSLAYTGDPPAKSLSATVDVAVRLAMKQYGIEV